MCKKIGQFETWDMVKTNFSRKRFERVSKMYLPITRSKMRVLVTIPMSRECEMITFNLFHDVLNHLMFQMSKSHSSVIEHMKLK